MGDGRFGQNNEREIELRSGGRSGMEIGRNPEGTSAKRPHVRTESNNQNQIWTPAGAILELKICRTGDLMPKSVTEANRQTERRKQIVRGKSEKMKPAATNITGTDKTNT
jgi:hypothetical protein